MSTDFREDLLQDYSEAELVHHIRASPRISPSSRVRLLSATLLAKHYKPALIKDTVKATVVAHQLGIRVPSIKRIITFGKHVYCIMERIQGSTLEETWKKLGWFMSIKLALQLRRFISLLRSVKSLTAGSLSTGECRSFWLEDHYGLPAKSSPEKIANFIQFWANFTSMRKEIVKASQTSVYPDKRTPATAQTFVLTHHDLAPRNVLLDSSGQLWLLDWDYTGFYPIYFEYASMQNFFIPQDWDLFTRLRWILFLWIAVGCYEQDARLLRHIRSKFIRFPVGRRFELLKKGGPSRYPIS
ncbi:kinase-like domain-containing protein [Phaeosphaeriaceae sp. PMI808]|nr:kinase-like domain-containing protein [Phaeosphaeriaceae sp. PMI808]